MEHIRLPLKHSLSIHGETIDSIIEQLTALKQKNPDYGSIFIYLDAGYNNVDIDIFGVRKETPQERDERLSQKKQEENKKIAAEMKTLEKLARKFKKRIL